MNSEIYKLKYIFKNGDDYRIIKGEVDCTSEEPRFYLNGANNLPFVNQETKDLLINEGVESLEKLEELNVGFVYAISDFQIDVDGVKIINEESSSSIHISIEKYLNYKLNELLKQRNQEYRNKLANSMAKERVGLIQPNISMLISEILFEYFDNKSED